jgi:hypothetical protein
MFRKFSEIQLLNLQKTLPDFDFIFNAYHEREVNQKKKDLDPYSYNNIYRHWFDLFDFLNNGCNGDLAQVADLAMDFPYSKDYPESAKRSIEVEKIYFTTINFYVFLREIFKSLKVSVLDSYEDDKNACDFDPQWGEEIIDDWIDDVEYNVFKKEFSDSRLEGFDLFKRLLFDKNDFSFKMEKFLAILECFQVITDVIFDDQKREVD